MTEKWGEIQGKWDLVRVSGVLAIADLGEEPGGPHSPTLIFRKRKKNVLRPPPSLSQGLDDRLPPILKV